MSSRVVWVGVATASIGIVPTYAVTYLTIDQAHQAIFPGATLMATNFTLTADQRKSVEKASGVKVRSPEIRAWRVEGGGWLFVDDVIGKHEFITYALGVNADGTVKQVEVMDYRENYGSSVRKLEWRTQFVGKKHGDTLKLTEDIQNVTGATMSCLHLTQGVKRLLAVQALVLKP